MSLRLFTLLMLQLSLAASVWSESIGAQSRFARTVIYLQTVEPKVRAEFATLALQRLHHVYSAEAEFARDDFVRFDGEQGLLSWSAAVERFAAQLPLSLQDIRAGHEAILWVDERQTISLQVAGRMLLLVHPRPDQQGAFEQGLLALFCARHSCDQFTPGTPDKRSIPISRGDIRPDWRFSSDAAECSFNKVRVVFSERKHMQRYRSLCGQLLSEIFTLADEMAWQRRHAVNIEWDNLLVEATPYGLNHRIQLNRAGDSALLIAPLLYRSPGLLEHIRPWLSARIETEQTESLLLEARKYGWE